MFFGNEVVFFGNDILEREEKAFFYGSVAI